MNLTADVSWHGRIERMWIGWPWLNKYGCIFPRVCSGVSHCKALAVGEVWYSMSISSLSTAMLGSWIVNFDPMSTIWSDISNKHGTNPDEVTIEIVAISIS